MNWLVKEEPSNYNFSQFQKDRRTLWSGVRNPVAQRNLRSMVKGDRVFFYHTGDEKAIVGTARVAGAPYPNPKDADGKLYVVELDVREGAARAGDPQGRQGRRRASRTSR